MDGRWDGWKVYRWMDAFWTRYTCREPTYSLYFSKASSLIKRKGWHIAWPLDPAARQHVRGRATTGSWSQIGSFYGGHTPGSTLPASLVPPPLTNGWMKLIQCSHPLWESFFIHMFIFFSLKRKGISSGSDPNVDYRVYACRFEELKQTEWISLEALPQTKRSYWFEGLKCRSHTPKTRDFSQKSSWIIEVKQDVFEPCWSHVTLQVQMRCWFR